VTRLIIPLLAALALTAAPAGAAVGPLPGVTLTPFAVCADYPNQASAQAAADTRDADGDGIYCESLPCPCSTGGGGSSSGGGGSTSPEPATRECQRQKGTYELWFSATKYPNVKRHFERAVRAGWPQILAINRQGGDARRDRLLSSYDTKRGHDRDEYPPAVGRGRYRKALKKGVNPTGWRAHVQHVPSGENRSHGALMGAKLRRFCNGQYFRYRFY
jgi:hypothetical protein